MAGLSTAYYLVKQVIYISFRGEKKNYGHNLDINTYSKIFIVLETAKFGGGVGGGV